jgi:acyl-CoA synthetase (NDP forming)
MNLDSIFTPSAVAVIGASSKKNKVGNIILNQLISGSVKFGRKIFPVNPNEKKIEGLQCYKSILDIPQKIDLAVIAVPAGSVLQMVKECERVGVGSAIIIAGGFKEIGKPGAEVEEKIYRCKKKMRILGPNTLGVLFPGKNLDTIFLPESKMQRPNMGCFAFISQSGAVAATLIDQLASRGEGISGFVGLGNKMDIDENECLDYFERDTQTRAICLYLESFKDPKKFMGKCSTSKKPIIVMKAGRTSRGSKAASLHTGSLAGSDQVVDGAFKQSGIVRAFTPKELLDLGKGFGYTVKPGGRKAVILGNAGGYCVTCTDLIESHGVLEISNLSEKTKEKLRKVVLPIASVENPVDLTASCTDRMYEDCLQIITESKETDCIICGASPQPPGLSENLPEIIAGYAKRFPITVYVVGGKIATERIKAFESAGVAAYTEPESAVRAMEAIWQWNEIERARDNL